MIQFSLFSSILGAAGILMSVISIVIVHRWNRRYRNFHKHMIASRRHLMNAVEFSRQGDYGKAELQLAACGEELERAELYL